MRKITSLLPILVFILTGQVARAQTRIVHGRITDEKGTPVAGASIRVREGRQGASTDTQGTFTLSVNTGDHLLISSVNNIPLTILVDQRQSFDLVLTASSGNLDSIWVTTALGIRRSRNSLPYATQQVSGEELNKTPNTNFINNLSGKVAGLQITASNALGGSSNKFAIDKRYA